MQLSTFKLNDTGASGPPLVSNANESNPQPQQPWTQGRSTLHVLGSAGGVKCTWLVDTGSDITFVSSKLPGIEKLKLCPTQSAPAAANGSPLGCVGEVVTSVQIGHVLKESVRVLVIQNLNTPAILGIDTLEKFPSSGIDWSNQTLKLGDSNIILEKRRHGSALSHAVICLNADHVIPARSQCFVTTTAKSSYWDKNDSLFTSFNDKMAHLNVLLGAGVASPTQLDTVPIIIMNNSEHPVKLDAGTRIGELSPFKAEDRTPTVNAVSREQPSSPMSTKKGPVAGVKGDQMRNENLSNL